MCNVVVHPYLFLFNARICGDAHAGREAQNTDSIQTAYHTTLFESRLLFEIAFVEMHTQGKKHKIQTRFRQHVTRHSSNHSSLRYLKI